MFEINNSFKKIASTIIVLFSSVVGAGLVTGRVVISFFGDSGHLNIFLFLMLFVLLSFSTYFFSQFGKKFSVKGVDEMSLLVFGKFGKFLNLFTPLFVFLTMAIMIAGIDSLARVYIENLNLPLVSLAISLLVIFIVAGGFKSVVKFNSYALPFVVILLIVTSILYMVNFADFNVDFETPSNVFDVSNSIFMTLLYIGGISLVPGVLIGQMASDFTKKESIFISLVFSGLLTAMIAIVALVIFSSNNEIFRDDMPMILIAKQSNYFLFILYSFSIFVTISSVFTVSAFALSNMFKKRFNKSDFQAALLVVSLGFIVSLFGFGMLIDYVYPLRGAFGIVLNVGIINYYFQKKKAKVKNEESY